MCTLPVVHTLSASLALLTLVSLIRSGARVHERLSFPSVSPSFPLAPPPPSLTRDANQLVREGQRRVEGEERRERRGEERSTPARHLNKREPEGRLKMGRKEKKRRR